MKLRITHHTRYTYDQEVQFLPHLVYLRPRENPLLQVDRFTLTVHPEPQVHWMRDDFDNLPATLHFTSSGRSLEIEARSDVTTADLPPFDFLLRDYAVSFPFEYEPLHQFNLSIYRQPPDGPDQAALRRWMEQHLPSPARDTVAWLAELNRAIFTHLRYQRRDAPGMQSADETLQRQQGTCRDFAVLLIACARTLGLAARFVSGYLFDAVAADQNGTGDMHAWVEIFLPGAGWRGLDPTHGIFCDAAYIPVAHAVVAESVNPVQGAISGPGSTHPALNTQVRVQRV